MNKSLLLACIGTVWAFCLGGDAVAQQTVALNPVKDNTLYESFNGSLSNGAGDHLFAGRTAGGAGQPRVRRALLTFDVAGAVPANATVDSVTLILHMSQAATGTAYRLALHRALADWGEGTSDALDFEGKGAASTAGDATWIHTIFDTDRWQNVGGDFVPDSSADTLVAGLGAYTWGPTQAMTGDVQGWLDAPEGNFGWILLGDEITNQSAKRFDSRDNPNASVRPVLNVFFSVSTSVEAETPAASFYLLPNYPNPFNPSTIIAFALERDADAVLTVYNVRGQKVATLMDRRLAAGSHEVPFEADGLAAGVYYYQLEAGGRARARTMTLLR